MNTTTPTPVDSVEELQRQLQTLRFRQMAIKRQPIELARNQVVDEEALGNAAALEAARRVLAERLRAHREFDDLGTAINALEARLANAESRVRIELATAADERLSAAMTDYRHASLTCAKSFRRLLQQAARSSNTPGAAHTVPDLSVHLPAVTPVSNQGSTGMAMSMGRLPFEED